MTEGCDAALRAVAPMADRRARGAETGVTDA